MKRRLALALLLSGSALVVIPYIVFLKASASGAKSRAVASAPARLGDRATVHAAGRGAPRINLADGREVLTAYAGDRALQQLLEQNLVQPLAMASGDFDKDGVPDLISAYAGPSSGVLTLHRGNVDAIYPNTTEANYRKAQGAFTDAPFLSPARVLGLPVSPDFIGAGDFDADGHLDLAAAARGGHSLYLLAGNGSGGFGSPESIELPGAVTALATGEINRRDGLADVIVGITTPDGPHVLIFQNAKGALRAAPESFVLPDAAMDFALGQFDSDALPDLAIAAGYNLMVVYGRDREASPNAAQPQAPRAITSRQSFPFTLQSLAPGDFTGKPQASLAALSGDGAAYLLSATFRKQGNLEKAKKNLRWKTQVLAQGTWSGSARLLKAKVSSLPQDDLLVIDSSNRQLRIIETGEPGGRGTLVDLDVDDEPVAALPTRLNADAINDLVILRKNHFAPSVVITAPTMTFVVDTFVDSLEVNSLRQAITDANASPGADTIVFAIGTGPQTINLTDILPTITEAVTIDGTTQPGFAGTPIIELNGSSAGAGASGLVISAGNSTVRGLVINRFKVNGIQMVTGGNNIIEGNFIGTDISGTAALGNTADGVFIQDAPNNTIGGTAAGARNVISGNDNNGVVIFALGAAAMGNSVQACYIGTNALGTAAVPNGNNGILIAAATGFVASNNTIGGTTPAARNLIAGNANNGVSLNNSANNNLIQGNFIGTNATGSAAIANGSSGVGITSPGTPCTNNTIGGTAPGAGNVISGNTQQGVAIAGTGFNNNVVQGNFIGTDASGTAALGNISDGVFIFNNASTNTIGGTTAAARNVISGNGNNGVTISSPGNQVQGNFIGTNASGTGALGNGGAGVAIASASNNIVGGTSGGDPNTIAFNAGNGISVQSGAGNPLLSNSIFGNGASALGINLADDVVTANDDCDPDTGPNDRQNYPVLTSATSDGATTTNITGTLSSGGDSTYTIEFFANNTCHQSGFGEGKTFIGSTSATTNASCTAPINVALPVGVTAGQVITATATNGSNSTSEFSQCVTVTAAPVCTLFCPPNLFASTSPTATLCGTVVTYPPATSDGCGTVTCTPPSGSVFAVGTTTVSCTAIDGPTCSFSVTVVDGTPPTITCSTGVTAPLPAGKLSAVVNYPAATATDNCTGTTVVCVPPSGSTFPAGSTLVTCTATDASDNANRCFFFVTLLDAEAPVIRCPANVSAGLPAGQTSAVVTYPPPTVTDNFPGVNVVCLPASGSSFPAGSTTVTCTATDATGNKSSCSFIVGVGGPQAKVTIPGNKTSVEFAAAPTRKPPKPKNNPCSFFTVENIGFAPLILTFDSIARTGSSVDTGRITDPNDTRFFSLSRVNADQSLTPLDIGAVLTLQPGQVQNLCAKFAALIPALAGKTTGLAASNVLPDTVTSKIVFRQNAGANIAVPLLARVSTGLVLVNLSNPRALPEVLFTRSGNDITVSYAVFDSNLDVSRAKYEFLDNGGQVVAGPFEIDLAASISSANLVRGQSFSVDQRFTGASNNPEVTGVRLTVFDGETSVGAPTTSSVTSISAASVKLMNRAPRVTLYPPDVKLR